MDWASLIFIALIGSLIVLILKKSTPKQKRKSVYRPEDSYFNGLNIGLNSYNYDASIREQNDENQRNDH